MKLPIALVGTAISLVFLQKATETYEQEPVRLLGLCLNLHYKLLYLGHVPFGVTTVYGEWIFRVVLGARWGGGRVFTAHLGCYYVFRLASYAPGPVYAVL
ncbi:MAG TPA: hypothetical protein VF629_09755 [Hymenobacter sp.]|uniref:hypothetical protein n=1 Tax=Hymenobacter sp. TaxID=1898978 RepID=UPI002ED96F4F